MTNEITNEILNEEQLDTVAGGNYRETAGDSRFLNDLGGYTDRYGATRTFFDEAYIAKKIEAGWKNFGITLKSKWGSENHYYYKNKEIFRQEAMLIACKAVGKNYHDMMNNGDY